MQRVCSVPQRGFSYLDIKGSLVVLYIYRKDVAVTTYYDNIVWHNTAFKY